jgi:hypothetical protein
MKVTRIQADNVLGIQSIDIKLATAITLFAGRNGSGKSSIQEAVRMAITQDHVRDVTVKKEFGALVHDGAKAGGAQITLDNNPDTTFAFNMPKGEFSGPAISDAMRVALHGQRFAGMKPDERRTFLFELTKCKPNAAAVRDRMLALGCDEVKVDAVLPLLRTGFPSVCEHAKGKATEANGAWRALTGETYGAVKAQAWEAPFPALPDGSPTALAAEVADYDKRIAGLNENLGAIKNAARTAAEAASKRATLAEAPAKVKSITDQLAHAKADLAQYEPTVVALRARAGGTERVGLVHDMMRLIMGEPSADMTKERAVAHAKIMAAYGKEYGPMPDAGKVDTAAQAALPEHEKGLLVMQNRVKNLQRDLDSAVQMKGQFDALAPADEAVDASAEIAEVQGLLDSARTARAAAENKRLDIEVAIKASNAAATKTDEAMSHHKAVIEWTKLADALAPDGIPAEILADALAPVNAALEQAALDTDWMRVVIGADMAIIAAGRPYPLLSESEQWRSDAMIAQVVAELSGLKIVCLDRCDVLDLPGRAQLFGWLDALADLEVIDTALLFATLKAPPEGLADTVECFWVENGTIASAREKAVA